MQVVAVVVNHSRSFLLLLSFWILEKKTKKKNLNFFLKKFQKNTFREKSKNDIKMTNIFFFLFSQISEFISSSENHFVLTWFSVVLVVCFIASKCPVSSVQCWWWWRNYDQEKNSFRKLFQKNFFLFLPVNTHILIVVVFRFKENHIYSNNHHQLCSYAKTKINHNNNNSNLPVQVT